MRWIGRGEIRTHVTIAGESVFETDAFGHSATLPGESAEVKDTEEEGFEPPLPFSNSVFKTDAISHSATLPKMWRL